MIQWSHRGWFQPDPWVCQLPSHVPGGEHELISGKTDWFVQVWAVAFLTAKAFQFNKMFQENIILEPVRSALGRRGRLITLRWSEQKQQEQGLSYTATKACQEQVGGLWALLKDQVQKVREGTAPGLLHDRSDWKVPRPSHGQRAEKAQGGGHLEPESDLSQIPWDLIRVTLCCFAVCIPMSLLPLLITLSPTWKGFIV